MSFYNTFARMTRVFLTLLSLFTPLPAADQSLFSLFGLASLTGFINQKARPENRNVLFIHLILSSALKVMTYFFSWSKVFLASSQPAYRLLNATAAKSLSSVLASTATAESLSVASFSAALAASTLALTSSSAAFTSAAFSSSSLIAA